MGRLIQNLSRLPLPDCRRTLKHEPGNLYENANDTLRSLLILLTRRMERMSSLSYIMVMNPHIATIWNAYLQSFGQIVKFITQSCDEQITYKSLIEFKITDEEINSQFVKVLKNIMEMHTDNVIDLRDGIHETRTIGSMFAGIPEKEFLDEHLSERILMRLIANNHILISENKSGGILDNKLNVLDVLGRSVDFVNDMAVLKYDEKISVSIKSVTIDDNGKTHVEDNINLKEIKLHKPILFPYIGNHIEYVLNELLKNSTRALIENHINKPLEILILLNTSKFTGPELQIKITDHGGGIRPDLVERLWEYSFTTVRSSNSDENLITDFAANTLATQSGKDIELGAANDLGIQTDESQADNLVGENIIAGMGYGLPLSSTYCRLFGGDLKLQSVWGKGTDVYVVFKGI